ncbi:hypothetical protein ACO1D2_18025 [Bacillus thuringiensis]|uniref:hypothetical protein n=1 Tax=Bacillus thuringiensis TaxID=1428 RepID=UPI003BF65684
MDPNNRNIKFSVKKACVDIGNDYQVEYATIVVEDTKTKFFRVHPTTNFIKQRYGKTDHNFNSQKRAADVIVQFLNWLLIEKYSTYQISSLKQLTLSHGVNFLNYLKTTKYKKKKDRNSVYRSRGTLEHADLYLRYFFKFLKDQHILQGALADVIEKHTYKANNKEIISSIFIGNGFSLPAKNVTRHEFKLEHFPHPQLITLLLEVSDLVAPEISFGIYLQIFGGLRRGEVVNVLRSDLREIGPNGEHGLSVRIGYKPYIWERLNDISSCSVKRDTKLFPIQPIQVIPTISVPILKSLKIRLETLQKSNRHNALFVDNNGNPMSGDTYDARFNKVKRKFLMTVKKKMPAYFSLLSSNTWGTHIGRRIYTNLMAKIVKSPAELAILRGDKSLESALVYMSKEAIREEIQEGLQQMYQENMNTNDNLDEEAISLAQQYNNNFINSILREGAVNFESITNTERSY